MTTTTADTTVVPEETDEARVLAHSYDGIREYDNPLPGWWRAIFWASIVFAAGYFVWFAAGYGETPDQKYRAALADYQSKKNARDAEDATSITEDMLARLTGDSAMIDHGRQVFAVRCASCHAADGRGLIGPNLTDGFQLHGSTRLDIFKTVRGGVTGTAMPAWGEQLPAGDIVAAATYVITLRGTSVAGGKAPQGQPVRAFDR